MFDCMYDFDCVVYVVCWVKVVGFEVSFDFIYGMLGELFEDWCISV